MSKKARATESSAPAPAISKKSYKDSLRKLQIELVKLQRHFIGCGDRILVIVEGRDAAGKDGGIKRIVDYLSRAKRASSPSASRQTGNTARGTSSVTLPTLVRPDPDIAFEFSPDCIGTKRLAR